MKGDIFSIFEKFITSNFGTETYEQALDNVKGKLSTQKPFVRPEIYPDSDFLMLLESVLTIIKVPAQKAIFLFGRYSFKPLASTIPHLMRNYHCSLDLLRDLDQTIHVEVRKLSAGTQPPRFKLVELEDGLLQLDYQSERRLYDLAEGLLVGMADYFEERIEITREVHESGICTFWLRIHE